MPGQVTFIERPPTVDELHSLARSVGWGDHYDWTTMKAAIDGSLVGTVVVREDVVIGCGRIVGDGTRYFYVQDVIVRPEASEEGLATRIVERLLSWVRLRAGASAVVGLFASPEAVGVYESLGFVAARDDPLGMTLDVRAEHSTKS
jgi:GNAT superfamily N-acetyltransferase